jgi:hypothetical protein
MEDPDLAKILCDASTGHGKRQEIAREVHDIEK